MQIILKVFKQTSWQILGKIITSLSTIVILGLITRNFGATDTGILTLALTYLGFFALITDFGLNVHVLPQFLGNQITIPWQKLLGLRLLLTAIATLSAFFVILFWPDQSGLFRLTVILGLVGVVVPGILTTCQVVFQSKLRFDLSFITTVAGTTLILAVVYYLVLYKTGVPIIMVGYSLGWLVSAIVALMLVKKYLTTLLPIFDFKYIKDVIKSSWPISLTVVLNLLYFRVDTFILSFTKTFADVGIYNVAYQIFQALLVFPAFVMNGYYPLMLKSFADNKKLFFNQLFKASGVMLALSIFGTILTLIFAPLVIDLVTGSKGFAGSTSSLQILSFSFPAFFLTAILMWTLITMKKYKTMLIIYVVGLIFNAVLNLIFIPQYSYIAASWITVLSEYLILLLQLLILIPTLRR